MGAPAPLGPSKGKGIGIEPFPPPRNPNVHNIKTDSAANNTNFALNQGTTTSYCRVGSRKLDNEDSEANTVPNTAKATAGLKADAEGDAEGDDDDMPKPRTQPVKREADISLILTPPQRHDLTRLNEEIHDKVFEQISKATRFLDHPRAQAGRVQIWNYAPAVEAAIVSQEAGRHDIYAADPKPGEERGPTEQEKPKAKIKIDISSVKPTVSSMSVLREETSAYFAKWKTTFNKRFADLSVSNQPSFSAGPPRQGQGAPRGGAMATGRTQQQGMVPSYSHRYASFQPGLTWPGLPQSFPLEFPSRPALSLNQEQRRLQTDHDTTQ